MDQTFAGLTKARPSETFFHELYERFARPDAWEVFPDVVSVLEELAESGLKLGVISNWDERLRPLLREQEQSLRPLLEPADRANHNLGRWLVQARLEEHGVQWVKRTTSTDPLVNVGMLWTSAILGWLNGRQLQDDGSNRR